SRTIHTESRKPELGEVGAGDLALPFELPAQAFAQGGGGLPSQMLPQPAGVRAGLTLIARPGGLVLDNGGSTRQVLKLFQDFENGGRLTAADVVGLADGRLDSRHGRRYTIADVGVAANLMPVAVHDDRLVLQQAADKAVVTHIRPLPRTVHREVTKDDN